MFFNGFVNVPQGAKNVRPGWGLVTLEGADQETDDMLSRGMRLPASAGTGHQP